MLDNINAPNTIEREKTFWEQQTALTKTGNSELRFIYSKIYFGLVIGSVGIAMEVELGMRGRAGKNKSFFLSRKVVSELN